MVGDKLVKITTEDGNFYYAEAAKDTPWSSVIETVELSSTPQLTQNWFAKLMRKFGRERVIYRSDNNLPYMYRYYLLHKPKDGVDPKFNVFIHNIVQSDIGDPHDHPWSYMSVILWGGYTEHIWSPTDKYGSWAFSQRVDLDVKFRPAGSIIFAKAENTHMVYLNRHGRDMNFRPAWTLFIRGPKVREWGFLNTLTGTWEHYRSYLNKRFAADRRSI